MSETKHKFDHFIDGTTYREWLKGEYKPLVEFIRALEGILGKKRTHEIVAKHNNQLAVNSRKAKMASLETPFESIEDLKTMVRQWSESKFGRIVQTTNEVASPPGTYRFCITECLWATVLRELGADDLGMLLDCNTDFASVEATHPKLRLERTKTLMQGDDCCDFIYHWDD